MELEVYRYEETISEPAPPYIPENRIEVLTLRNPSPYDPQSKMLIDDGRNAYNVASHKADVFCLWLKNFCQNIV